MYKVILIFLLSLQLFAYDFKETRYIYAIDKEILYEGKITFLANSINIEYTKPTKERVFYSQDDTIVQKRYFYTILKALQSSNETLLHEFFEVKRHKDEVVLLPLDLVKEYIKEVRYQKVEDTLKFLKIFMQNEDWIEIETTH